jgi:hypothetical protein
MQQLKVRLGDHIWDDLSVHAKLHEFRKHRGADINLSLFSFSEFCTPEEQELGRIAYMKDKVLHEAVPTKFTFYY